MFGSLKIGLLSLFLTLFLSSSGQSEEQTPARVLLYKQLLNKYVVESMDVVIKYSLYNVGSTPATSLVLKDPSFGPDFQVVGGQIEVKFAKLLPQANVTHTVVVRPTKFGYYNFTAASVTYKNGEDGEVS